MKRRAALNRQAAGVSLFPFLAVLLCTMGALIVVLVVIARQAHLQVAAAALQAETAAADGELALKQSDLEWRISQLRASRGKTRQQLADKQLELSHLEEHARRLRDQLDELAKARAGLSEAAGGDAREGARLRADLERLQHNAAALRLEVSKLTKNGNGQETYAILPYSGPNETRRRPIYIECRAGAIVLQPDGVVLTERDFIIDAGPSNPLASALRAARDYYLRNATRRTGEQGNPYPLLIIRPDGIREQELARLAIMSWGGDFGYELVAQDWPLEYPPPDPLLSTAMRQAVSEGRARQAYLASAAPTLMRGHGHSGNTYRASPHGGIMQVDGSPLGGDVPMGGMSGRRYRRPIGAGGNAPGSGTGLAGYRSGGGAGGSSSSGGGDENPYLDAIKQDERAAEAGGRGSRFAGGTGRGGTGLGGTGLGGTAVGGTGLSGAGRGGNGVGDRGTGSGSERDGLVGQSGAGGSGPWAVGQVAGGGKGDVGPRYAGGGAGSGTGNGDAGPRYAGGGAETGQGAGDVGPRYAGGGSGSGTGAGSEGAPGAAGKVGQSGAGGFVGQPSGSTKSGSATSGGGLANGSTSGTSANSQSGSANGSVQNRAGRTNNQIASHRTGTATGGTASGDAGGDGDMQGAAGAGNGSSAGGDGNAYRSGSSTGSYNRLAGGGARGGSGRSSMGGSPSNSSSNGSSSQGSSSTSSSAGSSSAASGGASGTAGQQSAQSSPGGMPTPMINLGQNGQAGQQSVAAQRGQKNWANPDAGTTSMAIERPIHMVCDSEHLTLLPETGGLRGMKVIRLGPRTETSVDDLVSAVWDRIDSWGGAGHGMYWRPRLQMIVEPGGQRRYTELQALLADSGFDVHGKPRTRQTAMALHEEPSSAPAGDRSRPKARIRRLRSAR